MTSRLMSACLMSGSLLAGALALAPGAARADGAPFDLAGPALQVSVTHAGATLPIGQVPNLSPGDQLAIRADLPPSQSAHYLLVVAFLRGATNPPPDAWFARAETWTRKGRDGLKLTVPPDAEQVVVFLAPQTGGDFKTLVGAVRGRPGAFVRASQDLDQASLDRSRLDAFLTAVRKSDPTDPDQLKTVSPLLARSLTIKLNTDCFQKMPELQAPCLMQGQDSLVLNDGHSTSIVDALTSGNPADLALQLSAAPVAGGGYSSAYVAAAFDVARILQSFSTAEYQYIPALALVHDDRLSLVLNTPPSFHNPLSVLVTALPAVEPPQSPPLRPVDPKQVFCAERTDLLLPVEGAPLAYSTHYAHDMVLRVKGKDGKTFDLPVKADAEKGGFIADTGGVDPADLGPTVEGALHGYWGFEPFDGPSFRLQTPRAATWRLAEDDQQALVVGRDDTIRLDGDAASCVQGLTLQKASGETQPVDWKQATPDQLSAVVPLADAEPGPLTLLVRQYGMKDAVPVALQAFAQAGRLESLAYHVGDHTAVLKGSRLDEVAGLTLAGTAFAPGDLTSSGGDDTLSLGAADPAALAKLKPGQGVTAKVALKDGRTVNLHATVGAPRPQVALIGKSVQPAASMGGAAIRLGDPDELPQGSQLTFSVGVQPPARFDGHETLELATADGGASATLSPSSGLTQEDPQVALASVDPAHAFGGSAFGPLQFRVVQAGGASDWRPLGVLVRLPSLRELKCHEPAAGRGCELSGDNLFLLDAVSGDPSFVHAVKVPEGFPGHSLAVPQPAPGRTLYIRLHDDPKVVSEAVFPTAHG